MEYIKKNKTFVIELWRILLFTFTLLILMMSCVILIYETQRLDTLLFQCENSEMIEIINYQIEQTRKQLSTDDINIIYNLTHG